MRRRTVAPENWWRTEVGLGLRLNLAASRSRAQTFTCEAGRGREEVGGVGSVTSAA
jgi:hypothetical protein